jgi:hypothetical protein
MRFSSYCFLVAISFTATLAFTFSLPLLDRQIPDPQDILSMPINTLDLPTPPQSVLSRDNDIDDDKNTAMDDDSITERPANTGPRTESLTFCPPLTHIPHHIPYLGPDYTKADKSIFEILESSDQTHGFVDALRPFHDLTSRLKDARSNSTVWAVAANPNTTVPQESAALHACLANHISPHWVPTIREMSMPNTPTLLRPETLNGEARVHVSLAVSSASRDTGTTEGRSSIRGSREFKSAATVLLNRHARIIHHDIMAQNGVIHLVDAYLPPLVSMAAFIESLPETRFGVLRSLVRRSRAFDQYLKEGKLYGGTFFAPDDDAFGRAGLDVDSDGQGLFADKASASGSGSGSTSTEPDYPDTLLYGHLVPNRTLFSNAFYDVVDGTSKGGGGDESSTPAPAPAPEPAPPTTQVPAKAAGADGAHEHEHGNEHGNEHEAIPAHLSVKVPPKSHSQPQPQSYQVVAGSNCYKVPWGRKDFHLPTMVNGRVLAVTIARAGGWIEMSVGKNGGARPRARARVTDADFLCSDGIVHFVDRVL